MTPSRPPLSLGRVFYLGYHRPIGWMRDLIADGGPLERRRTQRGRAEMESFAARLPPIAAAEGKPVELHLLTGNRFWYQTAFCLWSFARQAQRPLVPVVYDDGTLGGHRAILAQIFPDARFVSREASVAKLDEHLPREKFPFLRERWENYPNIRKLIDPHLGGSGWKLVIDSDLLFFRKPTFLLKWHDKPNRPLHAVDCETSYGYSRPLMNFLAGAPVDELVNVGLTGLASEQIDWEKLEAWCRELITRERTNYYLEQALIAMLIVGRDSAVAPAADYVTLPEAPEVDRCTAVMHHYVAHSKRHYFQQCWRTAVACASLAARGGAPTHDASRRG